MLRGLVDRINIGIDGSNPEIHDAIRGEGSFTKALAGIKALQDVGHSSIGLLHTETKINFYDLTNIEKLAADLGVDSTVCPVAPIGRGSRNRAVLEPHYIVPHNTSLEINNPISFSLAKTRCTALTGKISVAADGTVYPCDFLHDEGFALGNVLKYKTLSDALSNESVKGTILGRTVDNVRECMDCNVRYFCGGGCMAHAYYAKGSIEAQDPLCKLRKRAAEDAIWAVKES